MLYVSPADLHLKLKKDSKIKGKYAFSKKIYARKPRRGFSISKKVNERKHPRQAEKELPNANYYTKNVVNVVVVHVAIVVDVARVRVRVRILSTKPPVLMVATVVIRH